MLNYYAHIDEKGNKQLLKDHLQNVACLAEHFAKPFGGEDYAHAAGILHDIGKYSAAFQRRLFGSSEQVDHSTAGMIEALKRGGCEEAFIIAGHHSGLPELGCFIDADDEPTIYGRRKKHIQDYSAFLSEITLPIVPAPKRQTPFETLFFIRMLYSCLVDADFLDTEAFMKGVQPRGIAKKLEELDVELENYLTKFKTPTNELNEVRTKILNQCIAMGQTCEKGMYRLSLPTGAGKTLDSIAFALKTALNNRQERIIYVIPYTSIIDQTAVEFQTIFGKQNVLEHHSSVEYGDSEGKISASEYRKLLACENWDAPIVITTAVQFFESLFSNKSSKCRKLHNIVNSVIIFDEAQTLPASYLTPCLEAVSELTRAYNCTTVLCTATQPPFEHLYSEIYAKEPNKTPTIKDIYSLTSKEKELFERCTIKETPEKYDLDSLIKEIAKNNQALCVVNSKKKALNLYDRLANKKGVYCLTTFLAPFDRKRKIARIRKALKAGRRCVVISTSLIEAGVDLDFPVAYRELAGIDSIIQTAGRCNREGKRNSEKCITTVFELDERIFNNDLRKNIYATSGALRKNGSFSSEQAVADYFSSLWIIKNTDIKGVCDEDRLRGFEFPGISKDFKLIEEDTRQIIIDRKESNELVKKLRSGQRSKTLFRKLNQFTVSVYKKEFENLYGLGVIEMLDDGEINILTDKAYYNKDKGILVVSSGGNAVMI